MRVGAPDADALAGLALPGGGSVACHVAPSPSLPAAPWCLSPSLTPLSAARGSHSASPVAAQRRGGPGGRDHGQDGGHPPPLQAHHVAHRAAAAHHALRAVLRAPEQGHEVTPRGGKGSAPAAPRLRWRLGPMATFSPGASPPGRRRDHGLAAVLAVAVPRQVRAVRPAAAPARPGGPPDGHAAPRRRRRDGDRARAAAAARPRAEPGRRSPRLARGAHLPPLAR